MTVVLRLLLVVVGVIVVENAKLELLLELLDVIVVL